MIQLYNNSNRNMKIFSQAFAFPHLLRTDFPKQLMAAFRVTLASTHKVKLQRTGIQGRIINLGQ
jgi:hypothetical protein